MRARQRSAAHLKCARCLAGKTVSLPPEAEEVASFFAAILETDYPKNPTFVKNFFDSWLSVMKQHPPVRDAQLFRVVRFPLTRSLIADGRHQDHLVR